MTDKETAKRLEELEVKFAFQAENIEDLNGSVTKQWNDIETLKKQVIHLKGQIVALTENGKDRADNTTPPHY